MGNKQGLRQWLGTVKGDDAGKGWTGVVKDSQLLYQALFYKGSDLLMYSLFYSPEWGSRPYRSVLSNFPRTLPRSTPGADYPTWAEAETFIRWMAAFYRLHAEFCTANFTAVTGRPFVREERSSRLIVLDAARVLSKDHRRPPAVTQLPAFVAAEAPRGTKRLQLPQSDLLYQAVMTDEEEHTYLYSVYHSDDWGEEPYRCVMMLIGAATAVSAEPTCHAEWSGVEYILRLARVTQFLESEWCLLRFREVTNRTFSFSGGTPYQYRVLDVTHVTATEPSALKKQVRRPPPKEVPKPVVSGRRIKPPISDLPYLFGAKRRRPSWRSREVYSYEDKYLVYQGLLARKDDPGEFFLTSVYYDVSGLMGPFFLVTGDFSTRRKPKFDPTAEAANWGETYKWLTSYLDRYSVVDEWYSEDLLSWWQPSDDQQVEGSSGRRHAVLHP